MEKEVGHELTFDIRRKKIRRSKLIDNLYPKTLSFRNKA